MIIKPYPGTQEEFLASSAKECFYGGEAGGGKSFCLLIDAMRYFDHPQYKAIIFRRSYPDLQYLIGEAIQMYKPFGADYKEQGHIFIFPSGAWIKFNHLNHIKDIYDHQGAQYDFIAFDELPQFPLAAYLYLFSRLRGTSDIKRYIRGTGNPDGEHLLSYKTRFIDRLKPYEIGYFKSVNGKDTRVPEGTEGAISRQWIPCIRAENEALTKNDPDYEAMLDQLPEAKKQALKYGKWEQTDKPDQLIPSKWWERACSGDIEQTKGMTCFGFDYAEHGSDSCALIIGQGNTPHTGELIPYLSHGQAAAKIASLFETYGRYQTYGAVDSVGTGAGVWTQLCDAGFADQIEPLRYKPPEFQRGNNRLALTFDTLRSAIYWELRTDIEQGKINLAELCAGIDPGEKQRAFFDEFPRLQEEVLAHTYTLQGGVLKVTPKSIMRKADFLGRSPDLSDALAYWNYARKRAQVSGNAYVLQDRYKGGYENEDTTRSDTAESSGWI